MKRFLREAAIPLIVIASYGGIQAAQNESVRSYAARFQEVTETTYGAFTDMLRGIIEDYRERIDERRERRETRALEAGLEAHTSTLDEPQASLPSLEYAPAREPSSVRSEPVPIARIREPIVETTADTEPSLRHEPDTRTYETTHVEPDARETRTEPAVEESALAHDPDERRYETSTEPPPAERSARTPEPTVESALAHDPDERRYEPIEPVAPVYAFDPWRTSTIARMKAIEPEVERIARAFRTDPNTVYATLIVESSLDPRAVNEADDAYGLAQVRPAVAEQLGVRGSLLDPNVNLRVYTDALAWIREETGLEDFVTLNAIHSRNGPLTTLDAFVISSEYHGYRSLVAERVPYVEALADACDQSDTDLEAICNMHGTMSARYAQLYDLSVERSEGGDTRSAMHEENALLAHAARGSYARSDVEPSEPRHQAPPDANEFDVLAWMADSLSAPVRFLFDTP